MSLYKDQNLRREIIMKRYAHPQYKVNKLGTADVELFSKTCVDELHLKLFWKDKKVSDAQFSGYGCAIFLSSVDVMLEAIIGKTKQEILKLIENYNNMLEQKGEYDLEMLGKLGIFENVHTHLNRLQCAQMIYLALKKGLKNE